MDWDPKQSDIEWVKNLIRSLKEGGTWAVPCAMSIFTFYHSEQEYVLVGDPSDATNRKTVKILGMLGWKERMNDGENSEGRGDL